MTDEIRFIAASGVLGAGVSEAALEEALAIRPHFIASDAGTTDAGPFALGSGQPAFSREAVKHDLALAVRAGRKAGIPVLIGSAGTAGADAHVDWTLDILREIVAEQAVKLRTAVIYSEQGKGYLKDLMRDGRIRPLDPAPRFDEAAIERGERFVGMMGVEPLQAALDDGADIVLAGRCSDAALYAAMPVMRGLPEGLSWHAGKIAECGTHACEKLGKGVLAGQIGRDDLVIRPFGKGLRCTPQSIAAHSLYENADPYLHKECSGTLDLSGSVFEAKDDISVRVTGSCFNPADDYTVKLEGAERVGFQSLIVGGIRDPFIIRDLDHWLAEVREEIEETAARILGAKLVGQEHHLVFHVYGRDAVMGPLEPRRRELPHEVGIVFEATAPTQALASSIASIARQPLLHHPIAQWHGAITGFACLHNPAVIERGPVYRFNVNHVALPRDPAEMFRRRMLELA